MRCEGNNNWNAFFNTVVVSNYESENNTAFTLAISIRTIIIFTLTHIKAKWQWL